MVSLSLWSDFGTYSGGIYHHVAGVDAGGHAIRLIGWGHDTDGVLYWIGHN